MKKTKPNIVVLFSDQQRWDTLGCYGQKLPISPNLDQMAEEGVRYEYAFTCQPVCGPVRASLQTGKYPTQVGCETNHRHLPADADTVVIYTSDHGSHFKTRNGEYKRSCHDGCLRIPMIAYGPGFTGGEVNQNMVSLIDLPRTILSIAGVDVPDDWQGINLQETVPAIRRANGG